MSETETIYHYCRPEGFLKIFESHSVWLTHISYFEDQEEMAWFEGIVLDRMKVRDPTFTQPYHRELEEFLRMDKFTPVFCGSFSADGDMLSQWNAYADGGRGFAIGFNRAKIEAIAHSAVNFPKRIQLNKVDYDREQQERRADSFLDDLAGTWGGSDDQSEPGHSRRALASFFGRHNVWWESAKCKNPLFSSEREIRIIQRDTGGEKFRMRGSQVVPYVEFDFRPDSQQESPIDSIIFGPRVACPNKNRSSIMALMQRYGCNPLPIFENSKLQLL